CETGGGAPRPGASEREKPLRVDSRDRVGDDEPDPVDDEAAGGVAVLVERLAVGLADEVAGVVARDDDRDQRRPGDEPAGAEAGHSSSSTALESGAGRNRMPAALAPSSSALLSPTWTARSGGTPPSRSSASRKTAGS